MQVLLSRLAYEKDLHGILVQLVKDMDRKIERQKERAAKESAPRPATPAEQATLDAIKVRAGRLVQLCLALTQGHLPENLRTWGRHQACFQVMLHGAMPGADLLLCNMPGLASAGLMSLH